MKKMLFLFILISCFTFGQIDKTIKLKVAMMQNFVHKDSLGELAFWQTKGKITFAIVNYTESQNLIFKNLFIKQYKELLTIYKKMVVSEDENDTAMFVKVLITQEDEYRKLLTTQQLNAYLEKFKNLKNNNLDAYYSLNSLFFSDDILKEYKLKFNYNSSKIN